MKKNDMFYITYPNDGFHQYRVEAYIKNGEIVTIRWYDQVKQGEYLNIKKGTEKFDHYVKKFLNDLYLDNTRQYEDFVKSLSSNDIKKLFKKFYIPKHLYD